MAKNIVLCSDGTGNSDIKARGSNVFKLYEAVDIQGYKSDPKFPVQIAYYDDGVGTEDLLPVKILGGAFGYGLARNVRQLYTELVHVYEPGDKIFLFGFSRGAYTVRTLSGMIQYCGIVDRTKFGDEAGLEKQVKTCWREFRKTFRRFVNESQRRAGAQAAGDGQSEFDRARRARLKAVEHTEHAPGGEVSIEFIGVWDTVCALAMPFDGLRDFINYAIYPIRFTDLKPGPKVTRACQALALDEQRRTFAPELWDERGAEPGQIEQVWFAGVHSNVGGGYPKQGMSLVTLDWMMAQAHEAGLRFIPVAREYVRRQQDVHDKLYDSRAGAAIYYRWNPRDVHALCKAHDITRPRVHVSVFERIALASAGYGPGNLPFNLDVVNTPGRGSSWPELKTLGRVGLLASPPAADTGTSTSLLAQNRSAVSLGKLSYYVFLLATLLVVFGATCSPEGSDLVRDFPGAKGMGKTFAGWLDWVRPHLGGICSQWSEWGIVGAILLSAIVAWGMSRAVDRRFRREFTGFWHDRRKQLRDILMP